MKAVILVGGEGTRLRPLTYDVPKPMVPIVHKPFMEHLVDHLLRYGFDEIVFALGYKSEAFQHHFGDGSRWGARFWHKVEDFPLGTAGPVKSVENLLDETFLVLNGDVLTDIDFGALLQAHRDLGAVATLALTPVDDPSAYGVVVTDAARRVQAFIEKPPRDEAPSNWINAGVYVLEPSVLRYVPPDVHHMFERGLFPALVAAGEPLCAVECNEYWLDIGSPSRYLQANHDLLRGRMHASLPPTRDDRRWIDSTARVETTLLQGPMWIGAGCVVEADARLVGPLVLGAGTRVAGGARVSGAVLWDGCHVEADAQLTECLVGRNCHIGAGAVLEAQAVLGSGQVLEEAGRLEAGEKVPA